MNKINKTKFQSILLQGFSSLSIFLILPISIFVLDYESLAIWYILTGLYFIGVIFDIGFSHIFTIRIKYELENRKSKNLFIAISSCRLINLIISFLVCVILSLFVFIYFNSLDFNENDYIFYLINSSIIIFSISFDFIYIYKSCVLKAAEKVEKTYQSIFIQRFSQLIFLILFLLFFNQNLYCFTFSYLFSIFIKNFYIFLEYKKIDIIKYKLKFSENFLILKEIIIPSLRLGVVNLGTFLIIRSNLYVVNFFLGFKIGASFAILQQIAGAASGLAYVIYNSDFPVFLRYVVKKMKVKMFILTTIRNSLLIYLLSYFFGVLVLSYLVKFTYFDSVTLLSIEIIIFYCIINIFEINRFFFEGYLTYKYEISWLWPSLIAGIFILLFQSIVGFLYPNLMIMLLVHFIVQSLYNFWKWPKKLLEEIK